MAFETNISIRYSDLDPYNHVTSSRYMEFVEAAIFGPRDQNQELREKLAGLSQKQIHMTYRKAIPLVSEVRIRIEPEVDDKNANIKFQILSANGDLHSEGTVLYALADNLVPTPPLATPVEFPEKGMPRIFRWEIVSRFDDLGLRNEVALSSHFDLLVASRWQYVVHTDGQNFDDIMKKGWVFFLTQLHVDSHTPISGVAQLEPQSWLHRMDRGGSDLIFHFQMLAKKDQRIYSSGKFTLAVMDISTGIPKRAPVPDWVEQIFFAK